MNFVVPQLSMHSQQSTMFKLVSVLTVLVTVVLLVDGAPGNLTDLIKELETGLSTNGSSSDNNDNNGILSNLLDGLLEYLLPMLDPVTGPLTPALEPIIFFLDNVLAPVLRSIRTILGPIILVLNRILGPVNGISGVLANVQVILTNILANLSRIVPMLLSTVSSTVSKTIPALEIQTGLLRGRRGIADSIMGMVSRLFTMPFHLVQSILSLIFSSLSFIYDIAMWILSLFFGGASNMSGTSHNALSAISPLFDIISSFVMNLLDSSQGGVNELIQLVWKIIKELLPYLDSFLVQLSDSSFIPGDIKTWIADLHTMYSLLHMLGIL